MRAELQVLILAYIRGKKTKYLVLERSDMSMWQFVSGGGEDDEMPLEAAKREFFEETGKTVEDLITLDTMASIPASIFKEHRNKKNVYVIPEYSYGVELLDEDIQLSEEHNKYLFLPFDECMAILKYDSNRTALYELNERLERGDI